MNALIEKLESLDQKLFLVLNGFHFDFLDPWMLGISEALWWTPLYLWLLFHLFKTYPGKSFIWVVLAIGLSVTLTDRLSVVAFKDIFLRYRPCYHADVQNLVHLVKASCGGKYGFVSSHAANFSGLAVLFYLMLRKHVKYIGLIMLVWAALIGYSRIYLGVHYPADVIGGSMLGMAVGLGVFQLFKRRVSLL